VDNRGDLDYICAFHDDAHPIALDDSHRCFSGNEFAFGDDIDNMLGEARFATRSQYGDGRALRSRRECQSGCKMSRRTG
jgi:hypothetical protein